MKIKNSVVNNNDNSEFIGDTYCGADEYGDKARRLAYREQALKLVNKYAPAAFRSRPAEMQNLEMFTVITIDNARQTYDKYGYCPAIGCYIDSIALIFGVDAIKLFNDPDLPDFMQNQVK